MTTTTRTSKTTTVTNYASWLQLKHLHLRLLKFLFYFQILFYFHVYKILSVNKKGHFDA